MSQDPEDEATEPQHEQTFAFRGKPLAKLSFNHRAALYRFGEGHSLPGYEGSPYLVYMLLTKTPAQIDALRSPEDIAKFRLEVATWVDREKVGTGKGWLEVHELASAIQKPVDDAQEIEPVVPSGRKKKPGK